MTQVIGMVTAISLWAVILLATWRFVLGRVWVLTAPAAFIGYQAVNVFGLIVGTRFDGRDPFMSLWPFLVLLSFGCFLIGCLIASRVHNFRPGVEVRQWRDSPVQDDVFRGGAALPIVVVSLVGLVVGLWFSGSVGYNTFLIGYEQLRSGGIDATTLSALREESTRGEYRAVGYVSQFTAFILPAVAIVLFVLGRIRADVPVRVVALVIGVVDVYFLTIVGSRTFLIGALLSAFLIVAAPTSPLPRRYRNRVSTTGILAGGGVLLFGFATLLQGRGEGHSALYEGTIGLYDRLAGDYSDLQLRAIEILRPDAPVWGAEWWERLRIVLPGRDPGLMFDARLYGLLFHGNTNGNFPLDPWGSYYYNFGLLGLVFVPLVFGYLLQTISIRFLVRAPRRVTRVVAMSMAGYMFMFLCDPYTVLLSGPVTLALLSFVLGLPDRMRGGPPSTPDAGVRKDHEGRAPSLGVSRSGVRP